jgi:amino acid transporter
VVIKRIGRSPGIGMLLFAFAFAVMADPVSSVAYAIEAALRALHGDLALLVATMGMVLGIISLVRLNYDQLIRRFPEGGGAVAATGAAFGEAWAFFPLGALVVDFVLTVAISVAAAASAVHRVLPIACPVQDGDRRGLVLPGRGTYLVRASWPQRLCLDDRRVHRGLGARDRARLPRT